MGATFSGNAARASAALVSWPRNKRRYSSRQARLVVRVASGDSLGAVFSRATRRLQRRQINQLGVFVRVEHGLVFDRRDRFWLRTHDRFHSLAFDSREFHERDVAIAVLRSFVASRVSIVARTVRVVVRVVSRLRSDGGGGRRGCRVLRAVRQ